ncbi:MAG: transposase [Saprospiraceae bacterium]
MKKKSGYQDEIIRQRKLLFKKYEHQLDDNPYGECHLKNETIAQIVKDKLHEYDNQLYRLIAYCIMPNHVHVLFATSIQLENETEFLPDGTPKNYIQLDKIMKLIKGGSSVAANRVLGRKGTFWQKDSYDHFVRNEKEYNNIVFYILNNPVKARLVNDRADWPNTYVSL